MSIELGSSLEMTNNYNNGDKIKDWLNQFEEYDRELLSELLQFFCYYDYSKIANGVKRLFELLVLGNDSVLQNVIFIPVFKDIGVGFSGEFFNRFWIGNELKDYSEKNIYPLLRENPDIKTIAIVDDYSGSGRTIIKTIEHCIECALGDIYFYILTMHMSNQAKEKIEAFANEKGLECCILSLKYEDKCFDGNDIYKDKRVGEEKKRLYKQS